MLLHKKKWTEWEGLKGFFLTDYLRFFSLRPLEEQRREGSRAANSSCSERARREIRRRRRDLRCLVHVPALRKRCKKNKNRMEAFFGGFSRKKMKQTNKRHSPFERCPWLNRRRLYRVFLPSFTGLSQRAIRKHLQKWPRGRTQVWRFLCGWRFYRDQFFFSLWLEILRKFTVLGRIFHAFPALFCFSTVFLV